jgi:hypothetical protein
MTCPEDPAPAQEWGTWQDNERRARVAGLAATPEQRLRWLEEAIAFAHATGALPRPRPDNEGWQDD